MSLPGHIPFGERDAYAYDHRGRMVRKDISRRAAEPRRVEYTWDNWNIIREQFVIRHSSFVIHEQISRLLM